MPALAISTAFKVSSIGYHPQGEKRIILEGVPDSQVVQVVLHDKSKRNPKFPFIFGKNVYKFLNPSVIHEVTEQGIRYKTYLLDFSDFHTPGDYEVRLQKTSVKAEHVKINDFVYWDILKPSIKSFYFQRCGQAVQDSVLQTFHNPCHIHDARLPGPESRKALSIATDEWQRDVAGGWHYGNNYSKYVTATALSSAQLMALVAWNPLPFKFFRLNYPFNESGLGDFTDINHEIKAGLDWLLSMQRRDGAFYRKVSTHTVTPQKLSPDHDEAERFIEELSTADTAAAAAALAMAYRSFQQSGKSYGVKCLLSAEKAWQYLEKHPDFTLKRTVSTQQNAKTDPLPADQQNDMAYRVWAAAELYIATGVPAYHHYFLTHWDAIEAQPVSWQNPVLLGLVHYSLYAPSPVAAEKNRITSVINTLASTIAQSIEKDVYATGLRQYSTSSNRKILERINVLLMAGHLTGNRSYQQLASRSVLYLFGVNTLGMTYMTGLPGQSVQNISHPWVKASGKPLLGFLVDGPNQFATDGITPAASASPQNSYIDDAKAVDSNASNILNNASMSMALALLNQAFNPVDETIQEKSISPLDYKLAPSRKSSKQTQRGQ